MSTILQISALALTAALAATAAVGILLPTTAPPAAPREGVVSTQITPLPAANSVAWPSLIERSPFVTGRSAFARNAGPPAPELNVRLAGIFKVGKELRASVVVGTETLVVVAGDETPAGVVESVEPSAVVIGGQKLELFKQ